MRFSAGFVQTERNESAAVVVRFAHSPRPYSSGPPRVRNDLLASMQIVETLNNPADRHIKQVCDQAGSIASSAYRVDTIA